MAPDHNPPQPSPKKREWNPCHMRAEMQDAKEEGREAAELAKEAVETPPNWANLSCYSLYGFMA